MSAADDSTPIEPPASWRKALVARILLMVAAMFAPDHKTAKAIHDLHCHISVRVPGGNR